jgi:hypothetical protein
MRFVKREINEKGTSKYFGVLRQTPSRLLKNAHLRRCPHPSPCQARGRLIAAYIQVRLVPQDFGRLASGHF